MKTMISTIALASMITLGACSDEIEMRYPAEFVLPDLPDVGNIHTYNAPLYWSVYEYCYLLEQEGIDESDMDITPDEWDTILDWVADNLAPYGYDMVCTDGFIPMNARDESGYMTHYGSTSLSTLVSKAAARGLKVGVYDNPLWIHGASDTEIEGTDYTFAALYYNSTDEILNKGTSDLYFNWVVATHKGAQEYIDGFFKHYADLGVNFIRMDFMSWYEDGKDRNLGVVGHGYGSDVYARAMNYIAQAATKYGIFTSVVMPHLYNDALVEGMYGNMVRIVSDTSNGGWYHCSEYDRGKSYSTWPNCMNMFDGFTYWSHIAGRENVILDGDFIRLNTFSTDAEKETVVSLQLMAGGPVAVADQYTTIGDNLSFYTNEEMLALNSDRFVGKPLSDSLSDENNQIWYGQMQNGDYVVALFNRDDSSRQMSVALSDLGISGTYSMRDLWLHSDEGTVSTAISATVQPHGCKVFRLSI